MYSIQNILTYDTCSSVIGGSGLNAG